MSLEKAWKTKRAPVAKTVPPAITTPPIQTFLQTAPAVAGPATKPKFTQPYRRAILGRQTGSITDVKPYLLASDVVIIVNAEGPVHVDLVYQRFTEAWGIGRLGIRIREAIDAAIASAKLAGKVVQRGDFLWPSGLKTPPVRLAEAAEARKIEHIAPEELTEAVHGCVVEARSISTADLVRQTARLFGLVRITTAVETSINAAIAMAHDANQVRVSGDTVRLP